MLLFAVVLIFFLIFVLQNGNRVKISYLGAHGTVPLGVALLLSVVAGALLVAIPGVGRMMQLRKVVRRTAAQAEPPEAGKVGTPPM
jgi:lipopolysaccharide assembly protein A